MKNENQSGHRSDLAAAMRGLYGDEARKNECANLREINADLLAELLVCQNILVAIHSVEAKPEAKEFLADQMDANSKAIAKARGQS